MDGRMTMEQGASQPRRNGDGRWKAVVNGEADEAEGTDEDGEMNMEEESDELRETDEDGESGVTDG